MSKVESGAKYVIKNKNFAHCVSLLWLSRPLTPSGHFCQTFPPALVRGQQRNESKTIGQKTSLVSEKTKMKQVLKNKLNLWFSLILGGLKCRFYCHGNFEVSNLVLFWEFSINTLDETANERRENTKNTINSFVFGYNVVQLYIQKKISH